MLYRLSNNRKVATEMEGRFNVVSLNLGGACSPLCSKIPGATSLSQIKKNEKL